MISIHKNEILSDSTIEEYMIPADKVAHVQLGNNLEHALLVLTKTGYTAVPVLDPSYKLHGLLGTNMMMDAILGLQRIEFEKLEHMKVEEAMNSDIPHLTINDPLSKGLDLVIDHSFVCVVDHEGIFEGILTRRAILKQLKKQMTSTR